MTGMKSKSPKAREILTAAQSLMQDMGYNGFSFRDVAAQVGIKSASIHYHYPTKGDLAEAAAHEYRVVFRGLLCTISDQADTAHERLQKYGAIFVETLTIKKKTCLCGILASEAETLPKAVREQIDGFFDDQKTWLSDVIEDGKANGEFRIDVMPDAFAASFLSALEGAMMIARSTETPELLEQTVKQMIELITL